MSDRAKLRFMRELVQTYGRDPRLRDIAIGIIRDAGAAPRDYKAQAAALLAWVQTNIYYVNEPGEQIATPWRTLQWRHGDCDDQSLLLASFAESISLPWRFVLAGRTLFGRKVKYIEGSWLFPFTQFSHIYMQIGWPPFKPSTWMSAEPTLPHAPLGYDVIDHGVQSSPDGRVALPELGAWGNVVEGDVVVGAGTTDIATAQAAMQCAPNNMIIRAGDAPWYQRIDWDLVLNGVIQGVLVTLAVTVTTPVMLAIARRRK